MILKVIFGFPNTRFEFQIKSVTITMTTQHLRNTIYSRSDMVQNKNKTQNNKNYTKEYKQTASFTA